MPTGGITADGLATYLAEPSVLAVGGSWLVSADLLAAQDFARQYLRAPVILVMLLVIPALFVVLCASALGELSASLGDEVTGPSATAIGAGWAASFLCGILGYFQISSSSRPRTRRDSAWQRSSLDPLRISRTSRPSGGYSCWRRNSISRA
mgnify:CR=1 FL=1